MKKNLVLQASGVSISFGGLRAVSEFNCELYSGELVGLIGPNGAGKTTVFNMISGVYFPSEGQIAFWDKGGKIHSMNRQSPAAHSRMGIARTFQNIRLFGNLSAADNVKIALHNSRSANPLDVIFRLPKFFQDEKWMQEKAEHLLSIFKIDSKKNEAAKNLPYGEQRKLEIARALAASPKLLLLDEPAAGMNGQETADLMSLIAFVRKEFDLTILLIEHDMRLVMGICERIMVLDYGRTIASGTPQEIKSNPQVIKAYLGN